MVEACEVCGFVWDDVTSDVITDRVILAADATAQLLRDAGGEAQVWPAPDRWSMLVYGGHMRDVLYNLRDRIIVGAAEDNPSPKPMHMTTRLALHLYDGEDPAVTATELSNAARLFSRTVDALDDAALARPIFYPWPRPATRTLRWVAAQALHEVEHHHGDVRSIAEGRLR